MNRRELVSMITYGINKSFKENNPSYTLITIKNCYYKSHEEIKKIGKEVLNSLRINDQDPSLDKMVSNDYYVFEYKDHYVIINFACDIWEMAMFKLMIVKDRREALIHRYGE